MLLLMRILIKVNHLAKQAFIKQLLMVIINKILHQAISFLRNTMIITNQLLPFYTLLYLRVQCFISRVLFIVNLANFLLLMILSYTVFPVLFKRYSYSALDCAISTNRCLIRHDDNKLGRKSINDYLRFLQLLLCNNLFIGKVFIFKDAGYFDPISWDNGGLQQPTFFCALKYNNFSLISHPQDHCFLECDFHLNDIRFTFFLIFLMLLILNRKTDKSTIYFSVLSFLTIAVNVSIATWVL